MLFCDIFKDVTDRRDENLVVINIGSTFTDESENKIHEIEK